jgi:excinuclease ABC subunit A
MPRKKTQKSSDKSHILVRGARVNNLKNIDIDIPKNKFVVVTGLSGSGKSSLAFDTIFAEGNRRYVEGMSSYARTFLDVSSKPDVDSIENLSPPISIDQKSVVRSPRSTVGTLTEIYDYLRILFAHAGELRCHDCGKVMSKKTNKEILSEILSLPNKTRIVILSKYQHGEKNLTLALNQIRQLGYARVCLDGKIMTVQEAFIKAKDSNVFSSINIVIDRLILDPKDPDKERILDSVETAMRTGEGSMIVLINNKKEVIFNRNFICHDCGNNIKEINPRNFSFNNPEGACRKCSGLGARMKVDPDLILPNKKLSLAEGAIKPWGSVTDGVSSNRQSIIALKNLSKKLKFSLNKPLNKLKKRDIEAILYGYKEVQFEGIVGFMEKKYRDTKSEHTRNEVEKYMTIETCSFCDGKRIKKQYLNVFIDDKNINDWVIMPIVSLVEYLKRLLNEEFFKGDEASRSLLNESIERLDTLNNVGLGYLSLSRGTQTISGGEAQRIRLATQIKSKLTGIIYVLDEPSIGLHSRDNDRLIETIKSLRDADNSLVVVEHDRDFMKAADWIIDMGKGAGEEGGEVIFSGTIEQMNKTKNSTAEYIKGKKTVFEKSKKKREGRDSIDVIGANENNLKNINIGIPLERMVVVCGVSGSGKSTLVNDILARVLNKKFYNAKAKPGKHKSVKGLGDINKVVNVTQSPIGKTPRSNAATYTGVFSHIRDLFAKTEESQNRKYSASRFSFNIKGGRCEVCQGEGKKKIEMHLLPDMYVECEACDGTRYNKKTLDIEYQGANIAEILKMSVSYASKFFRKHPLIYDKLKVMEDVGLGYLKLGQSAVELSGGEAQRIKLATELARKSTGKTMYILDEPTVGLHFDDIKKLLNVCDALVDKGNSILIVEHNEDVIRSADWVIELGPEGGEDGGHVVFEGSPEDLKKHKNSPTGRYL